MEITNKKIPHNYRNKYLKNTSVISINSINNTNLGKQSSNDVGTRAPQEAETVANLQTQINELRTQISNLQTQINELKNATSGGDIEDPTV